MRLFALLCTICALCAPSLVSAQYIEWIEVPRLEQYEHPYERRDRDLRRRQLSARLSRIRPYYNDPSIYLASRARSPQLHPVSRRRTYQGIYPGIYCDNFRYVRPNWRVAPFGYHCY